MSVTIIADGDMRESSTAASASPKRSSWTEDEDAKVMNKEVTI
jgi:hypothetical protein